MRWWLYFVLTICLFISRKQSALLEEKRNKLQEKLEKRDKRKKKKKKDKSKSLGDHYCIDSGPSSSRYLFMTFFAEIEMYTC